MLRVIYRPPCCQCTSSKYTVDVLKVKLTAANGRKDYYRNIPNSPHFITSNECTVSGRVCQRVGSPSGQVSGSKCPTINLYVLARPIVSE